jgi:hypothetical protein
VIQGGGADGRTICSDDTAKLVTCDDSAAEILECPNQHFGLGHVLGDGVTEGRQQGKLFGGEADGHPLIAAHSVNSF